MLGIPAVGEEAFEPVEVESRSRRMRTRASTALFERSTQKAARSITRGLLNCTGNMMLVLVFRTHGILSMRSGILATTPRHLSNDAGVVPSAWHQVTYC
jgi:hypothetical protein